MSSPTLAQQNRLRGALAAIDSLQHKLALLEMRRTEPIAIVGMGCRFPGGGSTPAAFWDFLCHAGDAIREIPSSRWDIDALYSSDRDAAGKMYVRSAGVIDGVDQFDAGFFGISPKEAASIDPQHRLLLEVSWEALQDAGIVPSRLSETLTGVFVGIGQNDYGLLQLYSGDYARVTAYDGPGNGFCFASGRLSYALGAQGPSLSTDTACSSSLVSVHLACQSLRSGECNVALAAGVQLILAPDVTVFLSRVQALSPDGQCRAFDADANGYARGEGCGVVVLKRLSDAQREGDNVLAIIRGSNVNHDGPSSSLTVPNGLAQQRLIEGALRQAGVAPGAVGYVEAHGTGTIVGDPIEVDALLSVFGASHSPTNPLRIGSVKTNVGHLEAAAGMVGLIKVVLALKHGQIPAHLHLHQPNPLINWGNGALTVPTALTEWCSPGGPRIAGVSAFGMSGTNAHLILEEAPPTLTTDTTALSASPIGVLPLSARSPASLWALARSYEDWLDAGQVPWTSAGLSLSAGLRREHFPHRAALVFADRAELRAQLQQVAEAAGTTTRPVRRPPAVAFLFTGQGSQYAGMGLELFEKEPLFRQIVTQCHDQLREIANLDLLELLRAKGAGLEQTVATQPALFVLEYALARTWQHWGIRPSVLLGHSVGEYAAACLAGVFSLEDALTLIAARGRLMQALPAGGGMLAVRLGIDDMSPRLSGYEDDVAVAAINGPQTVVLSGDGEALARLQAELTDAGIGSKALDVSHAFHSHLMKPMLAEFRALAEAVTYHPPTHTFVSSVTGACITDELASAKYWVAQISKPVRFEAAVHAMAALEPGLVVEIGPQPLLLGMAQESVELPSAQWLPSMRRGRPEERVMKESLARAYAAGAAIDWRAVYPQGGEPWMPLPLYCWNHASHWLDTSKIRRVPRAATNTDERVYAIDWVDAPLRRGAVGGSARWVLFGGDEAAAAAVRAGLKLAGIEGDIPLIDWSAPAQIADALRALAAGGPSGATGVIFLATPAADETRSPLDYCVAGISCLQAVVASGLPGLRVWFLTVGQVYTGRGAELAELPYAAGLWGIGRVAALEHPDQWGGLVDLPLDFADTGAVAQALGDLVSADGENQLAYRGGHRLSARLRAATAALDEDSARSGAVLITGGTGGIGPEIAEWYARAGADAVYLVSRGGPSAALRERFEKSGAPVHYVQADVAVYDEMRRAIAAIAANGHTLRSVVHAAGILDDALIVNQNAERFAGVMAAKFTGACVLHELTRSLALDEFIMCSSAASVLGSVGQANYAAANAFLDVFMGFRRAHGLPGCSINWGPWADVGMAAQLTPAEQARIRAQGVRPLKGDAACLALARALDGGRAQAMIADLAWDKFFAAHPLAGQASLFADLAQMAPPGLDAARPVAQERRLATLLASLPAGDHLDALRDEVAARVGAILGIQRADIDFEQGFFDMGMDSLTAVQLRRQLDRVMDQPLAATVIFDFPTVADLATHLRDQLDGNLGAPADASARSAAGLTMEAVQALSDADAEALIDQALDQL